MSERIPCRTEGCSATILPATAEKTGGICMPCHQELLRLEQEAYIRENRKDVDVYAGITDPVEILRRMHTRRPYNPLERVLPYEKSREEVYASLSSGDIERLKAYAVALIEEDELDTPQDILAALVCWTEASIADCLPLLMSRQEYHPSILYMHATAEIRDELIRQLDLDADNRNAILLALAWIGDEKVVELFREWRAHPPVWTKELYIAPEAYAREAGWELTADAQRRNLYDSECYPVVTGITSGQEGEAAAILGRGEQQCGWCGSDMTVLFDLDMTHPLLQGYRFPWNRLRIATCISCTCYGYIYTDVDADGQVHWSRWNREPDYWVEPDEENPSWESIHSLGLSASKRSAFHAASWTLEAASSQLGGHPTWIQDAEYPACPSCSATMKFVGQLDWEDVEEYGEGIYYAFICPDCRIAATNYQQT